MNGSRLEHAACCVADLDAAIAWYGRWFGFTLSRRGDRPEFAIRTAHLLLGEAVLELIEPAEPLPRPAMPPFPEALRPLGCNHLAIAVPDVVRAEGEFRAAGETVVSELIERRLFFVRDPWGSLIEVKQGS